MSEQEAEIDGIIEKSDIKAIYHRRQPDRRSSKSAQLVREKRPEMGLFSRHGRTTSNCGWLESRLVFERCRDLLPSRPLSLLKNDDVSRSSRAVLWERSVGRRGVHAAEVLREWICFLTVTGSVSRPTRAQRTYRPASRAAAGTLSARAIFSMVSSGGER